jgi:TMEM175 potassium channel family protein
MNESAHSEHGHVATKPEHTSHVANGAGETARLEAFSDGVFAIAITLLVIEIHAPPAAETHRIGLWAALGSRWPSYLAYVISFVSIGIMWANHHTIFQYIRRTNRTFLLLNVVFLMFISFLPYPTAVLAEYLPDPAYRKIGALFYSLTLVGIAINYNLVWRYGVWNGRLLSSHADQIAVATISRRYLFGPAMYGLSALLALVDAWASLAIHGLLMLFYAFSERTPVVHRRRRDT